MGIRDRHATGSLGPVDHSGQGFGANHQRSARSTTADEVVSHAQRVHEAGTGGIDVERRTASNTQALLDQAGGRRKDDVGRGGADDDQVDFSGIDTCSLKRAQRGLVAKITGGFAFGGDMTLADAGAAVDPFVGGIDDLGQIIVGQHFFRQVTASTVSYTHLDVYKRQELSERGVV